MRKNGGQYLKKFILLCGESDGERFKRTFTITRKVDAGASVVCYEAFYENSIRGILKEFYPEGMDFLVRDKSGQLLAEDAFPGAKEVFREAQEEYIKPYRMLQQAGRMDGNQDLATFIPGFEIYFGCDEAGNIVGTTYIWTPEPERETFYQVCQAVHQHPEEEPEHKLVLILNAVESLTKCIRALHAAGMIHRDIKPSNFGFLKRGKETLTQAVSLFDVDCLCSAYHIPEELVGTAGYIEPEAGYERANVQTDIYSIGAVLYQAIVVSDQAKQENYLYRDEFYEELKERVDSSLLIQASEANAHPKLRSGLTRILRKCLAEREERYSRCEELLEDLENVLYYALPSEIARKKRSGEQWVLQDAEKMLDRHKEKNSLQAIQYHLYRNPLYYWCPPGEKLLNVLLIGLGSYGQKFLDTCLQVGQIRGKMLEIMVISDDPADKELYLEERPELAEFFRIDHAPWDREDMDNYGNIFFETLSFSMNSQKENKAVMQDIFGQYHEKKPQYVFIALGDDALNLSAAKACKEAADILEVQCCINYTLSDEVRAENSAGENGLFPVYINWPVSSIPEYREMERMALNVHLVWEKDLNLDFGKVKANFRKPYNYDSCMANVLYLKYKLYSMGIDLGRCSFREAAKQFASFDFSSREGKLFRDELVWAEHKRWVAEKLCSGWRRMSDLESCLEGKTKDKKKKRHICILRSRPGQKLTQAARYGEGKRLWDGTSSDELAGLDELDRMSVELHRVYAKKAEELKQKNLLEENSMAAIGRLIEEDKRVVVAYQEWLACIKDIEHGDIQKTRLYQGLKQAFLSAAEALPARTRQAVKWQADAWEVMFFPVLASGEYRDWKQDDCAMVDEIPFILTYSEDIYLAVPFATRETEVFDNVAAATVINPKGIIYLCYLEKPQELADVKAALPYITGYLQKKQIRASIDFVIAYTGALASYVSSSTESEWKQISSGRVRRITWFYAACVDETLRWFSEYLQKRQKGKRRFAVEKNETRLSALLLGAGVYRHFDQYQFDSASMNFSSPAGDEEFSYIQKMPCIRVTDMAAFRLSSGKNTGQPEFFSGYQELWEKYRENSGIWKQLCDTLQEYARSRDVMASFKKKGKKERAETPQIVRCRIPSACHRAARKILEVLKQQEIAGPGSQVRVFTSDSYEVVIEDICGYAGEYNRLFADVYPLMQPEDIHPYLKHVSHEVLVVFDNLVVKDVQIGTNRAAQMMSLLNFLAERGYVMNLCNHVGKVSFTYSSHSIKKLLTSAGKLLEIYVYHKIKELGRFDDVVSSFELEWEDTAVKSEFDCIATKGFRSLFIECKARKEIDADVYYRLSRLAEKFGINAKAVLVADTEEKSYYDIARLNAMQRERGSMINVITVWKPEEIENIGYILLKIINGTYKSDGE